jgi:undecaprenyl-diphosphatase
MHMLITLIAQYFIIVSLGLTVWFFLRLPSNAKRRFLVQAVIGGVCALILAKIGSILFYDPRPFVVGHFIPYFSHNADNGFPSDHTLLSSFVGFLVLKYNKTWGLVLLSMAAIIGLSRMIAGVHHSIDIAGSFLFAGISVLAVSIISSHAQGKQAKAKR